VLTGLVATGALKLPISTPNPRNPIIRLHRLQRGSSTGKTVTARANKPRPRIRKLNPETVFEKKRVAHRDRAKRKR